MTDNALSIHWRDQREGKWTQIAFSENEVRVYPRRSRILGVLLTNALVVAVVSSLLSTFILHKWGIVASVIGVGFGLYVLRRGWQAVPKTVSPLVVIGDEQNREEECYIFIGDIINVVLRENTERNLDDLPMWQVYINCRQRQFATLIHQQPLTGAGLKRARALASELAGRWNTDVVDVINTPFSGESANHGPVSSGEWVAYALCAASCIFGGIIAVKQLLLAQWPIVQCVLVSYTDGASGEGSPPLFRSPRVRFDYVIDGNRYHGKRANPSPLLHEPLELTEGQTTACWYNPSSPAQAYIVNRGVTAFPVVLLAIGMAGCVFGLVRLYRRRLTVRCYGPF